MSVDRWSTEDLFRAYTQTELRDLWGNPNPPNLKVVS